MRYVGPFFRKVFIREYVATYQNEVKELSNIRLFHSTGDILLADSPMNSESEVTFNGGYNHSLYINH